MNATKKNDQSCRKKNSCFSNKVYTKVWRLRGSKDILGALKKYKELLKRSILFYLKENQPIKFYITLKTHLSRMDNKTNEKHNEVVYFHGKTRTILSPMEFEKLYNDTKEKIWNNFDCWMKNGSGYRIERIKNIQLTIAKYNPIFGTSYLKTPKSIIGKHAVINIRDSDDLCFLWAVLSALKITDVKNNQSDVRSYKKYLHTLKYDLATMPMQIENIGKFEKMND